MEKNNNEKERIGKTNKRKYMKGIGKKEKNKKKKKRTLSVFLNWKAPLRIASTISPIPAAPGGADGFPFGPKRTESVFSFHIREVEMKE